MPGFFVTFEGPEGSGKTTQVKILKDYLEKKGHAVLTTREPGGTLIGQQIRNLLLAPESKAMREKTELFLYAADRSQHVEEVIKPALAQGKIVLCDRFTHSTIAYQGYGRGLDKEIIHYLNDQATGSLKPDLVILLDVVPKVGLRRALGRAGTGDRMEQEKEEFHQRVRQGFLKLAQSNRESIKIIDAGLTKEQVSFLVRKAVDNLLGGDTNDENQTASRG